MLHVLTNAWLSMTIPREMMPHFAFQKSLVFGYFSWYVKQSVHLVAVIGAERNWV